MKSLHNQLAPAYLKDQPKDHKVLAGMVEPSTHNKSHTSSLSDITINTIKKKRLYLYITTAMMMGVFSTNAIARNLTCPTGYVAADLSPSDYQQLSAGDGGTININGINNAIAALGLQLTIDMTQFGSQQRFISSYTSNGKTGFTIAQNLDNHSEVNTVTFEFNKPVNKLSFTLYDIDYRVGSWRDKITVKGKNGNTLIPLQFSNPGDKMTTNNTNTTGIVESNGPSFWAWEAGIECLTPNAPYNILGKNDDFTEKCAATVTFENPITQFSLVYDNTVATSPSGQNIEMQFNKFCVEEPTLKIEKDDGVTEVTKDSVTNYVIKVKNQSNSSITNATLSDPSVSGLIKQSGIQCDTSTSNNACITAPTITQLENGFILPTLAQGQTYAITVPTQVTANVGSSITNTATVQYNAKTISAEDTNTVKAAFAPPSPPTAKQCPTNHQMYYIGDNNPYAAANNQPYDWSNGTTEKTYTFIGSNGNQTKMKLAFPLLTEPENQQPSPYGYQEVPFYYTNFDITTGAINLAHKSVGKKTNHRLQVTINKPVSQFGFIIQDLDSTGGSNGGTSGNVQYIEQVDVSMSAGKLLNHDSYYHTINATQDIVTAIKLRNCKRNGAGPGCPIDATWGYKSTNQPFILEHNNTETRHGNIQHLIGYSDFYFCLAPPKIIINKVLNGNRIASEQFNIKITDNNAFSKGFTTEGNGNSITLGKNTSGTLELKPNQTYTITESVVDGGSNADYSTTYKCSNSAEDSSAQIPQNGTGKSFSISNLSYGDEIVCTITNTPNAKKTYTFSGIVFNDNGGKTVQADAYNQAEAQSLERPAGYFNGIYDANEEGISANDLKIQLTDCKGTKLGEDQPSSSATEKGRYSITVPESTIQGLTDKKVCIIEQEPQAWKDNNYGSNIFPVDTTANQIEVPIINGQYSYPNKDFGEVRQNNAALVLIKRQRFLDCSANIDYDNVNDSASPSTAFSIKAQASSDKLNANQCIAYRIDAFNRANNNITLTNISIVDTLNAALVSGSKGSIGGISFTGSTSDQITTGEFTLPRNIPAGSPTTNQKSSHAIYFKTTTKK